MNSVKKIILLVLISLVCIISYAQLKPKAFLDMGKNNASDGFVLNTALTSSYQFGKNIIDAGVLFDFSPNHNHLLKAVYANAVREFNIGELPFSAQGLFTFTNYSELLVEYNWGLALSLDYKHFTFKLGNTFKTYSYTRQAIQDYNIDDNEKYSENFNLLYLVGYRLKPEEHNYNIGIALTNIDYFLINQPTNPMLQINGNYSLSPSFTMFAEAWLKTAGAFNLSINYFGFFVRTGVIWEIDL